MTTKDSYGENEISLLRLAKLTALRVSVLQCKNEKQVGLEGTLLSKQSRVQRDWKGLHRELQKHTEHSPTHTLQVFS